MLRIAGETTDVPAKRMGSVFKLPPASGRIACLLAITFSCCELPADDALDFSTARSVLTEAIQKRAFPGCAVAVGTRDRILWSAGFGHYCYDSTTAAEIGLARNPRVTPETLYDLASLTKVIGTTSVVMSLVQDKKLKLTTSLSESVPQFRVSNERRQVSVEHLLTHSSGLPAWRAFYKTSKGQKAVLDSVTAVPLDAAPGNHYRYSDLGYMLLGKLAADSGGASLDELEQKHIFEPLKMKNTLRRPAADILPQIAPTERDAETGKFIHGVVHDENCRAAGGVTGHAGLFSNVSDLSLFAQEMLKALKGKGTVFAQATVQQFVARRNLIEGSSRALGWDTPSGRSSGGSLISKTAFGHTGFTGTSIWIDPDREAFVILLTNRVHPSRKNSQIAAVRRNLTDAVWSTIDRSGNSQ